MFGAVCFKSMFWTYAELIAYFKLVEAGDALQLSMFGAVWFKDMSWKYAELVAYFNCVETGAALQRARKRAHS